MAAPVTPATVHAAISTACTISGQTFRSRQRDDDQQGDDRRGGAAAVAAAVTMQSLAAHHATSPTVAGAVLAGRSAVWRRGRAGRFAAATRAAISSGVNPAHTPAAGRVRSV